MNITGEKSELILNLCNEVSAKSYISGPLGRDYLDINSFKKAGIDVLFHNYNHPKYSQHDYKFLPNLSVIDLIFNEGPESSSFITNG